MDVGERIKLIMKQRGYSQLSLSKKAQISQSGLSTIINGGSSPSATTLAAIANALDCSVSELMGEESDQQPEFPKTKEAKSISAAIDRMPIENRKQAESLLRTLYEKYFPDDEKAKTS